MIAYHSFSLWTSNPSFNVRNRAHRTSLKLKDSSKRISYHKRPSDRPLLTCCPQRWFAEKPRSDAIIAGFMRTKSQWAQWQLHSHVTGVLVLPLISPTGRYFHFALLSHFWSSSADRVMLHFCTWFIFWRLIDYSNEPKLLPRDFIPSQKSWKPKSLIQSCRKITRGSRNASRGWIKFPI